MLLLTLSPDHQNSGPNPTYIFNRYAVLSTIDREMDGRCLAIICDTLIIHKLGGNPLLQKWQQHSSTITYTYPLKQKKYG
jgi:hypothetical protein